MTAIAERSEKANTFLVEHPLVSWVIWVLVVLTLNTPVARTAPLDEPTRFGPFVWLALAEFIGCAVFVVRAQHNGGRLRPRDAVALCWAIAQGPVLMGYAAQFLHAPQALAGAGVLEAIVLMAYSLTRARRDVRNEEDTIAT